MAKVISHFFLLILCSSFLASCATEPKKNLYQSGKASWYGERFHGRKTASGEIFDMHAMTAAHPELAFGTLVMVRSKTTRQIVQVRINDRGPFTKGRIIDLSYGAAKKLGIVALGEDEVEVYF